MRGCAVSAIVNLHREGHSAEPSLRSAVAALDAARDSGLSTQLVLVMDRPDAATSDVADGLSGTHDASTVEVDHGDLGLARNSGVAAAAGEIVAFLDADDLWGDEWLVRAHSLLERADGRVVAHPEINLVHGAAVRLVRHPDSADPTFDPDRFRLHNAWTALSCAPRSLYEAIPFPPNRLEDGFGFEDWSWNAETLRRGIRHQPVPDTVHVITLADDDSSLKARSRTAVRSDWIRP